MAAPERATEVPGATAARLTSSGGNPNVLDRSNVFGGVGIAIEEGVRPVACVRVSAGTSLHRYFLAGTRKTGIRCTKGNLVETSSTTSRILQAIRSARSIVITSQSPLDGDSVGCELALLHTAEVLAPGVAMRALNETPPSRLYDFLTGIERLEVLSPDNPAPEADLLVILDCGDLDRFAYLPGRFPDAHIVNIDHHQSNPGFGDIVWVAPDHASSGEQVFELFQEAGVTPGLEAAEALYLSMVFDTGRFAYSNTRPDTHRYAARLVELGVRPEAMFRALDRNRTRGALRMMAFAIQNLNQAAHGRLGWVVVRADDMAANQANPDDLEDLVNLPMTLKGVEVSVLFKERADGRIKASLRSDRWFDVAAFARRFGGGGHIRAAGMTLAIPVESLKSEIVLPLTEELEKGTEA